MRLFSLLYIAASHTVHAHYFSCVLLVVIFFSYFFFFFFFFSQLTLKTSRMLQSAVRSDQRRAIYWPKSYLLVLFIIIIVKAGVVPTNTD